jgi:asparagine synthase (glutamine-hydrolysing)
VPGLAAIVGQGRAEQRALRLSGMVSTMRHEPYYVTGELCVPEMGVWAGWTAHPGSFASQVSAYRHPDGSALLFCGECFPAAAGQAANTPGAPERLAAAVIEGCRERGPDYLRSLNGLFSGILIDRTQRSCLFFNDRFGSERLYRHESDGTLWLASEAKAILHACPGTRRLDSEAVGQLLKFGSVLDSRTLFRGIELVPGGSAIVVTGSGEPSDRRYFRPEEWEGLPSHSMENFTARLAETLASIVPRYLQGDQPIGMSITGGLDTRMIMAALPEGVPPLRCYTFGGLSGETLDERIGRQVAERCGFTHETLRVDRQWLDHFSDALDRTVWISDGTAGAITAHEIHLTRLGRLVAPVRVTGNYGSEVLRGMSTLKPWAPPEGFLSADFGRILGAVEPPAHAHPITRAAFREVPLHLFGSLAVGRSQVTFRTPYLDNELVELAYRAPPEALRSAEPSLRAVAHLSPALAAIPTDRGVVLGQDGLVGFTRRASAAVAFKLDYLDKEGLPDALWPMELLLAPLRRTPLLGQHKYLAYRRWFRHELNGYIAATLANADELDEFVDPTWRRTAAQRHAAGRENLLRPIGAAIMLAAVQRRLLGSWHSHPAGH